MTTHRTRVLIGVVAGVAIVLSGLWLFRWRVGHSVVTVADPLVRAWASGHVLEASDSVYHLEASTITVDDAHRRLSIDSITLTTDTARNARLARPHPEVTLRFRHCAITGINLAMLASAGGLHAAHAGCDSVALDLRTTVAPVDTGSTGPAPADSNNFLRFQGKLDLPGVLPFVSIDTVAFPHLRSTFDLLASDGRRTGLAVDSIAVALDSVRIDPSEAVAKRRPLFARNVRVQLDHFEGRVKSGELISLQHLTANLEDGTGHLDAIDFERPAGERVDSTGLVSVRAEHVALSGTRWRTFLLSGDIAVGLLQVDSVLVHTVAARNPRRRAAPAQSTSIRGVLRSAGRAIWIDSLDVHAMRAVEEGRRRGPAVTTLRRLTLAHLDVAVGDAAWARPFPVGRVTLVATGLLRRGGAMEVSVGRVWLDAAASRLVVDSLHAAPPGDDSAFERRVAVRTIRLSISMPHAEARGIDLPAFLASGALRTRALVVNGFSIDAMNDKHKPESSEKMVRRTPQQAVTASGTVYQVDTVFGTGLVTYRERDDQATTAGTLTFGAIQLRGYNFSTDPARMTARTPFRLIGDAKLMGTGPMHVEWDVPLLAHDYEMDWHGSLGEMNPMAMNAFLPNAIGMRFTGGSFARAEWQVTVHDGHAVGTLAPRWHGLGVALPGVARQDSSLIGGFLRGVARIAANTFAFRGDNDASGGNTPLNAPIDHQWRPTETLPDFIWTQLRDALLSVLKK